MKDWVPSIRSAVQTVCFTSIVVGLLCTAPPKRVSAETLETLLPYVIENHDRVRASKSRLTAARNRAREALGDWFPTLSQTANAGHETQQNDNGDDSSTGFHEWDISLTQLLWDFGSTNAAIDKARLQVEAARYDLIETRQSLILEAITAYLNVIRSNAALNFAKDSEENIRKQTGLEEALVGLGSGFSTDVLQAKTQLAGAQARRAQSEGGLSNALNRYQAVFGRMPDEITALEQVPFPAPFLPTTLTQATDIAFESNPSLKNAILDADIAMEDLRKARADNFMPKIDATAERKFKKNVSGTIGAEQETLAKVEMTFDFNLGFTAVNTLKASESDLSATTFTAADTRRNIEEQVRNAWQQLQTAKQTASHLNNQANIAAAFLELARNERQLGRRSLIDVLSGETNLINAKSDAQSAETDVLIAAYGLLAAAGLLEYDVIKRSKGIKAPTSDLPESAPAAETPGSTPTPAPLQPVTPDSGQINGQIEPDVTVAGGRSLRELQEIFKNVEAPDMRILPDTVQTFGRSQSGDLVMRPKHPPKPKSRYESFADFDVHAGAFTPLDEPAEPEFASNASDEISATVDSLPPDSDTGSDIGIGSTPAELGGAGPVANETITATGPSVDDLTNYRQDITVTKPENEPTEVAALSTSVPEAAPASTIADRFSLKSIFSFFNSAHDNLVAAQTKQPETQVASVSMDMPRMPLPAPDTAIEVSEAPASGEFGQKVGQSISNFLGDVVAFFEKSPPANTMAEEVAAIETPDVPAPVVNEATESSSLPAPTVQEVAAVPPVEQTPVTEPIRAEENTNKFGALIEIFNFFETAHQRSLNDKNNSGLAAQKTLPTKSEEKLTKVAAATDKATDAVEEKSTKPTLLSLISDLFGSKQIKYTPSSGGAFDNADQH
ncbi:MAG: TolC family protein [Rhodospirillales bacterium]|nr:TolC family protein [Rhodospirillales bacterium]